MALNLASETLKELPDGTWEVHVVVCNDGTEQVDDVLVTEHPWSGIGPKMKKQPDGKFISLQPKGSKNAKGEPTDCQKIVFGPYEKKPKTSYTDVYIKKTTPDSKVVYERVVGVVNPLAWLQLPPHEGGQTVLACVAYLPHPWRFALTENRALNFFVRDIRGLPNGWEVTHLHPALGEQVRLAPEVKHWPIHLQAETSNDSSEGFSFHVAIEVGITDCPEDDYHSVVINLAVARDTLPPNVDIRTAGTEGVLMITATDEVTGINRAVLRYSLDGGSTWESRLLTAVWEQRVGSLNTFVASADYAVQVPGSLRPTLYSIDVYDGVDNRFSQPVSSYTEARPGADTCTPRAIPIETLQTAMKLEGPIPSAQFPKQNE
jgi:hypothetical protein